MSKIRVLVVEDFPIIRSGIRNLLSRDTEIEVIGETGSGSEALQLAKELQPDVIILDMELQELSGLEVAKSLKEQGSQSRILVFSAHNDREYVQELLKNNASGYLIKDEAPEFIIEAVHGVARGEQGWVSRQITAKLQDMITAKSHPGTNLTNREEQVLKQVVEGKTNREIGGLLQISEKTVEKHLETIYQKLGVLSRTEAAVWAAREEQNR